MKTHATHSGHEGQNHYARFLWMAAASFFIMYLLMYAMVDRPGNVIPNINQCYMALLMTASMVILELLIMWSMYRNRKLNAVILLSGFILLCGSFFCIRRQTAVSDRQFLKSMIPHHAAAILMVQETDLGDPELVKLAQDIIRTQQQEIDFMKKKLRQLEQEED